ncbi:MAG: class I SAM-dependent methyltransferase, partial [Pontiellaceae bacterium]|nr:class I SAM-dependent methyltransferase [Pontiellaceae bacterium]
AHYDLGNDFYQLFLDNETMMYSAALFQSPEESLPLAQKRKIHRLAELADIREDHHVLEIGCGWGGFAIETAKQTGCRVTGITISEEQYKFAKKRVAQEGLENRVSIELCDYRDLQGRFDRIVSIEMLEAVGHAFYGTFFSTCDRLLNPGGRVALQVITIPDQRYDGYRANPDWIQKHIFPGGMLPSLTELSKAMTQHSAFTVEHLDNIGVYYAETLRRWRSAFEAKREELLQLGYDETFQRKWIYYLCYCEAGFQTRFTNNLHLVLTRPEPLN